MLCTKLCFALGIVRILITQTLRTDYFIRHKKLDRVRIETKYITNLSYILQKDVNMQQSLSV